MIELGENLTSLVRTFGANLDLARGLVSPNPEDDIVIRMAVVGFSYESKTEEWGRWHYEYIWLRLHSPNSIREFQEYGQDMHAVRLFSALCYGYVLGVFNAGVIEENVLLVGDAMVPSIALIEIDNIRSEFLKAI